MSQVMKVEHLLEDLLTNGIDLSNLETAILNPTAVQHNERKSLKRRNSNEVGDGFSSEDLTFSPNSKASPKYHEKPN